VTLSIGNNPAEFTLMGGLVLERRLRGGGHVIGVNDQGGASRGEHLSERAFLLGADQTYTRGRTALTWKN